MQQLKYQLKNVRRDKLCLLTFLLPIIVGIAINLLPAINFQTISELSFGCIKNDLPEEDAAWLLQNGNLTEFETKDKLEDAVNDPATQMIGVLRSESGICTVLSGDELELYRTIGKTLPQLYENSGKETVFLKTVVPITADYDGLKSLLIVITLITAMFMGCTFNSMNIIGEKEDGIAFVNQILPMNTQTYILQKLALGFLGGIISTSDTAFLCIKINFRQIIPFFLLIVLAVYIASLIGLFIGYASSGMMMGITYIKMIMIVFLAFPVLIYLMIPAGSTIYLLSYLLPSSAAFYGLMDLLSGQAESLWINLMILAGHTVIWNFVFLYLSKYRTKKVHQI